MSQEMPNFRRFLALVFCSDNQMTIILGNINGIAILYILVKYQ